MKSLFFIGLCLAYLNTATATDKVSAMERHCGALIRVSVSGPNILLPRGAHYQAVASYVTASGSNMFIVDKLPPKGRLSEKNSQYEEGFSLIGARDPHSKYVLNAFGMALTESGLHMPADDVAIVTFLNSINTHLASHEANHQLINAGVGELPIQFKYIMVDGRQDPWDYLAGLMKEVPEFPLSRSGSNFFHDINAHLWGYLSLSEKVLRPIRARIQLLQALRRSPVISSSPALLAALNNVVVAFTNQIDESIGLAGKNHFLGESNPKLNSVPPYPDVFLELPGLDSDTLKGFKAIEHFLLSEAQHQNHFIAQGEISRIFKEHEEVAFSQADANDAGRISAVRARLINQYGSQLGSGQL